MQYEPATETIPRGHGDFRLDVAAPNAAGADVWSEFRAESAAMETARGDTRPKAPGESWLMETTSEATTIGSTLMLVLCFRA
jgi:hypothetical protein